MLEDRRMLYSPELGLPALLVFTGGLQEQLSMFHSVATQSCSWPWPFLVSCQSWLGRDCPDLLYGPTLLRGACLVQRSAGTGVGLGLRDGLDPAAPRSTLHIPPPQGDVFAPSSLKQQHPAFSALNYLCRQG